MTTIIAALGLLLSPTPQVPPWWVSVAAPPAHVSAARADRGYDRPPIPSVFKAAPHTHAGLVAWLKTLRWPWAIIATCESVRDDSWRVTAKSWARGVFQFLPSTWARLGRTGDPAAASWRDQLDAAKELSAIDHGYGDWDCARIEGVS